MGASEKLQRLRLQHYGVCTIQPILQAAQEPNKVKNATDNKNQENKRREREREKFRERGRRLQKSDVPIETAMTSKIV